MEKPKYTFTSGCFAVSDDGAWSYELPQILVATPFEFALRLEDARREAEVYAAARPFLEQGYLPCELVQEAEGPLSNQPYKLIRVRVKVVRSPLRLTLRRWGVRRKMLCVLKWIALTLIFPVVAFLLLYILIFETEEN